MSLRTLFARFPMMLAVAMLAACAAMPWARPAACRGVVGIEPAEGQGLELRLAIKLRIQNPNDGAVEFDGTALELDVNGKTLATGVSDQKGSVPRYGESILVIPVSISAMNAVRQALVLADGTQRDVMPYVLRGKLAGGAFGTVRFTKEGSINLAALNRR